MIILRSIKCGGDSDHPYFEAQRKSLQAVADFKLPGIEHLHTGQCCARILVLTKSDHTMQNTAADALQTIPGIRTMHLLRECRGKQAAD